MATTLRKLIRVHVRSQFNQTLLLKSSTRNVSSSLKEILSQKISDHAAKVKDFRSVYGNKVISKVTIDSIYRGMRGLKVLVTETSNLDPEQGIQFRGYSIPEIRQILPKAADGEEPLPEAIFWLLLTGEVPTVEQVKGLSKEWADHADLPTHVVTLINNFPSHLHPMSQFAAAIMACDTESVFYQAYSKGIPKSKYWEYIYDDSMMLLAKLPTIAATIYRNLYRNGTSIGAINPDKDWAANFVQMLGFNDNQFADLMRLQLTIYSDHEGGNVSANAVQLAGSTLSTPFLALAAGVCGMAGPLHGRAGQEVIKFLENLTGKLGDKLSEQSVADYCRRLLDSGQIIPGFGHAVLRTTDPRYTVLRDFCGRHFPDYPMFKVISLLHKVVPSILLETGKVKNPWPNVDAQSGVTLQYFGLKETEYHTVVISISRALGVLSSLIWDRGLLKPLINPRSLPSEELMRHVGATQYLSK